MAAKYLKSLTTGVVFGFNEAALKNAEMRLMDPAECEEYERSLGTPVAKPEPTPEVAPEPAPEEPVAEDTSLDVDEVVAALKVD
jgi:hypothetical protein